MKLFVVLLLASLGLLAGCASPVANPVYYVLRVEPPAGTKPPVVARTGGTPWHLVAPVRVPDYLEREALLLPQGQNGLLPSPQHRWAEPLSQSVPRLLVQDLGALRGESGLWTGAVPRGLAVRGQLRVELLALDVNAASSAVALKARWTTSTGTGTGNNANDGAGQPVVFTHSVALTARSQGADADSLVSAHRQALWELAQAIAKTMD